MATILVTGCAGFIGSHFTEKLLREGHEVIGIDNFDPFYDRSIKQQNMRSFVGNTGFHFLELDLANASELEEQLAPFSPEVIVHLAGKAGVRPSIEMPHDYTRANITATQNLLELMRKRAIRKLVFASSSSVYGNTKEIPFREDMDVSFPISPYAFTKKACELVNYTYHSLYQLDIINLRFFTVFGPRQRPDLAIHKFTKLILNQEEIPMFGTGDSSRDYTYFEDTVSGVYQAVQYVLAHEGVYETFNLGNNTPVKLRDMIAAIEKATGQKANIKQLPMQAGDVDITYADISKAQRLLDYNPQYSFEEGVQNFVDWYRQSHSN